MESGKVNRIETVSQNDYEPLQEDDFEWLAEFRQALDPHWTVREGKLILKW